ncbi:arsenate reductase ArsC [candidate division KSB1 bacterium]|nr:arsenate reductase ArsC [candidate division KSB1 bacterium]
MKKNIIVLCTGNSCRSQIAEGYIRHMAGERFNVVSAGIEPSKVNPRAIQVMQEDGIDISHHTSDDVQKYVGDAFDYIITVCDNAKERCPVFPGSGERIHWSFPDPADATGTDEQILNVFRAIRDQIKSTLENFVITY